MKDREPRHVSSIRKEAVGLVGALPKKAWPRASYHHSIGCIDNDCWGGPSSIEAPPVGQRTREEACELRTARRRRHPPRSTSSNVDGLSPRDHWRVRQADSRSLREPDVAQSPGRERSSSAENRGTREVLLVTSRDTGRWVIPKGSPMKGWQDREAAAQEAFEEAGVKGKVHRPPDRNLHVRERHRGRPPAHTGHGLPARGSQRRLKEWPEKDERRRRG